MKTKNQIRSEILEKRKSLTRTQVQSLSHSIAHRIFALSYFHSARDLHCYVSAMTNEVETFLMLEKSLADGKHLFVPKINLKNKMFSSIQIYSLQELCKGTFGIPEPQSDAATLQTNFDVVIVPVLAVDEEGNRLGLGGGYYDKFLKAVSGLKIGIAYDFQILPKIPTEEHDVKLDILVTESRIIKCVSQT